jgi:hypothetical protein
MKSFFQADNRLSDIVAQKSFFHAFPLSKGAMGDVDMERTFLGNYTGG